MAGSSRSRRTQPDHFEEILEHATKRSANLGHHVWRHEQVHRLAGTLRIKEAGSKSVIPAQIVRVRHIPHKLVRSPLSVPLHTFPKEHT